MNDNVKRWVDALRSDAYEQARRVLYNGRGYCCLGVACKLYGEEHGVEFGPPKGINFRHAFLGSEILLPPEVEEWLGLREGDGSFADGDDVKSLAELNDTGSSFAEIADVIEAAPPGLFKEADA